MHSLPRVRQTDRASERNAVDFETRNKQLGGCLVRLSLMVKLTRSQSSLSLLLILTREARLGEARGVMGRMKEFPFYLLIVPLVPGVVIVFRDRSVTANDKRRLGTSSMVKYMAGKLTLVPHKQFLFFHLLLSVKP